MLEFIVLGQIPGTNIYLSFSTIALMFIAAIIIVTAYNYNRRHNLVQKVKAVREQDLINSQTL